MHFDRGEFTMMGDACICIDTESEEFVDWDEKRTTDSRARECAECRRPIPTGTPHVLHLGHEESEDWDDDAAGEWADLHRECLCCAAVRGSFFECGWYIGRVWSDLRNHMDEVMPLDEDDDSDESWCDPPTKPIGPSGW